MDLEVDQGSSVPPYEQVRTQVVGLVASGGLRPGDRLPPVRRLAADLGHQAVRCIPDLLVWLRGVRPLLVPPVRGVH